MSPKFSYSSLYENAQLTPDDKALLDALGTRNFEEVLNHLRTAALVCKQLGHDRSHADERYESIRHALITAVHAHHVVWSEKLGPTLRTIHEALRSQETVFTTSYDLLIYWAIIYAVDGELIAEHPQLSPGAASVLDEHYPTPRKAVSRGPRARTDREREFLALGEPAEQFIRDGAAAGVATLGREIIEIVSELIPAHGEEAVTKAIARAVKFGRYRAVDIRSILAIGPAPQEPAEPGDNVVIELPSAEVRSLDAYRIENLA